MLCVVLENFPKCERSDVDKKFRRCDRRRFLRERQRNLRRIVVQLARPVNFHTQTSTDD